jgi:hypothetical protein
MMPPNEGQRIPRTGGFQLGKKELESRRILARFSSAFLVGDGGKTSAGS